MSARLGRRLVKQGHCIEVDKRARVKYHTLKSLVKSDHIRASHFMKLMLRERLAGDIAVHKRFAAFRLGSIVTVAVVPDTFAVLPLAPVAPTVWPLAMAGMTALVIAFVKSGSCSCSMDCNTIGNVLYSPRAYLRVAALFWQMLREKRNSSR